MNRNLLGDYENHFFASIFFEGGIIPVLLLFVWDAILGAVMHLTTLGVGDKFSVAFYEIVLMNEINGNLTLCGSH